jgi:hypothetical protein
MLATMAGSNIHGPKVEFVEIGDLHDTHYQGLEMLTWFDNFENVEDCTHSIHLYLTSKSYFVQKDLWSIPLLQWRLLL